MSKRLWFTNLLLFVLSLVSISGLILPYSSILFNGTSFHFSPLELTYCAKKEDCRHEVGHQMDTDMKHISKSKKFGEALMLYVMYQLKYEDRLDKFGVIIFTNPGMLVYSDAYQPYKTEAGSSPQEELYAKLYAEVDGDISKLPPLLQQFYKNDTEYDEIYNRLVTNKIYIRSTKMDQLKALYEQAKAKISENKETVIKIGAALGGALIGAVVTALVLNNRSEDVLPIIDDEEDEELEDA